jgi:hypothetical protein
MYAFQEGNTVRANVTEQGMTTGNLYTVMNIRSKETPWGTLVLYIIADENETLSIGNGHMLLTKVAN